MATEQLEVFRIRTGYSNTDLVLEASKLTRDYSDYIVLSRAGNDIKLDAADARGLAAWIFANTTED